MSNIGKAIIKIPESINISLISQLVTIKGPLGTLTYQLDPEVKMTINSNQNNNKFISFTSENAEKWGTTRTNINNILIGVTKGYKIDLVLSGVGHKVTSSSQPNELLFHVGYSHIIPYTPPANITINLIKPTLLSIFGIDKQLVSSVAAIIRKIKTPEIYKGKGIKYLNEKIKLKEGKKK